MLPITDGVLGILFWVTHQHYSVKAKYTFF